MKLPNADCAMVDIAKLRDYCLDPQHEHGKHKARVFASALGLGHDGADLLRQALLQSVHRDAVFNKRTSHGSIYVIDFPMKTFVGAGVVRGVWIVRESEDFPRLVTCYVL